MNSKILYKEAIKNFRWDLNKNEWVARLRASDAIAFVPPVTPLAKDKNKYFGYLLLNSVKGFTSFDDLKVGHGTYEEACIALAWLVLMKSMLDVSKL